jgi:hypothetical protein
MEWLAVCELQETCYVQAPRYVKSEPRSLTRNQFTELTHFLFSGPVFLAGLVLTSVILCSLRYFPFRL